MLPSLIKAAGTATLSDQANKSPFNTTTSPVIGIVTQPLPDSLKKDPRFEGKTTYIMEAYSTFMETAGARVVPIIMTDEQSVTDAKLAELNGVLFPGGAGDYLEIGDYIYKYAIAENDKGNFYPIWGTCLGFENLAIFASDSGHPLSNLESTEHSLTLDFLVDPTETKMFSEIADPAYYGVEAMTFNHHSYGVSLQEFTDDKGLGAMFTPTSLSTDPDTGDTFVATMESPNYPFFGTQFHPEKVLTMYNTETLDHSWASVQYNRYFADRFLELSRENTNTCDFKTGQSAVIQNYDLIVTDTYYGSVYAF